MEARHVSRVFETLSFPIRLPFFKLLAQRARKGFIAGDIAKKFNISASNLAFHLKAITQSGLIFAEKEGRHMREKANIPFMLGRVRHVAENYSSNTVVYCELCQETSSV